MPSHGKYRVKNPKAVENRTVMALDIKGDMKATMTAEELRLWRVANFLEKAKKGDSRKEISDRLSEIMGCMMVAKTFNRMLKGAIPAKEIDSTVLRMVEKNHAPAVNVRAKVVHEIEVDYDKSNPDSIRRAFTEVFGVEAGDYLLGGEKAN